MTRAQVEELECADCGGALIVQVGFVRGEPILDDDNVTLLGYQEDPVVDGVFCYWSADKPTLREGNCTCSSRDLEAILAEVMDIWEGRAEAAYERSLG